MREIAYVVQGWDVDPYAPKVWREERAPVAAPPSRALRDPKAASEMRFPIGLSERDLDVLRKAGRLR